MYVEGKIEKKIEKKKGCVKKRDLECFFLTDSNMADHTYITNFKSKDIIDMHSVETCKKGLLLNSEAELHFIQRGHTVFIF